MTVVSGMKFNQKEGAIVSDEQSSSSFRKEDIANKIHKLELGEGKPFAFIGGSGYSDILYDSAKQAKSALSSIKDEIKDGRGIACFFGHVFMNVKRQYLDGALVGQFGLREIDFQAGFRLGQNGERIQLDQSLIAEYNRFRSHLNSPEGILFNAFLMLTYDNNEIELYKIVMDRENPIPVATPSDAIGSGFEQVEDELASYFRNIPRAARGNIDPIEGLSELLYGTERASIRNPGVGGTPLVKIVKEGVIISPGEDETKLAVEIAKGRRAGYLSNEFEYNSLKKLLYGKGNFEEVEEAMWLEAEDKKNLDKMLRGYKVRE